MAYQEGQTHRYGSMSIIEHMSHLRNTTRIIDSDKTLCVM